MKKIICVNMFGSPGSGKSLNRADLFVLLKKKGIKCDEAIEYAKGKVYEGTPLKNQVYIFGKQHNMIFRIREHVDVIVTDSPLLLSLIYGASWDNPHFKDFVLYEHHKYHNINYYLTRPNNIEYQTYGRTQGEKEAEEIGYKTLEILRDNNIDFKMLQSSDESLEIIFEEVLAEIEKLK